MIEYKYAIFFLIPSFAFSKAHPPRTKPLAAQAAKGGGNAAAASCLLCTHRIWRYHLWASRCLDDANAYPCIAKRCFKPLRGRLRSVASGCSRSLGRLCFRNRRGLPDRQEPPPAHGQTHYSLLSALPSGFPAASGGPSRMSSGRVVSSSLIFSLFRIWRYSPGVMLVAPLKKVIKLWA